MVPYTRGEEVSRPFDDVLMEVADLADQGVKEVTLLGQNVNAYRGAMGDSGEIADFAMLLEYVHEIPGIERIRYTTSHPKEMTQRMMDAYARLPKLETFLHLPVQAGSDRVLAAMKRGYTTLEFKSVVRRLRAARPNLTLSSDFIVGFPGETEEDFEKTMKLIEDVGFDTSFSFVYSRRPGTPAADLSDDTPQDVKLRRLQRLQALINEQAAAIARGMIGTRQRLLVEGPSRRDPNELMGRTENNRIVNFAAPARLIGQMVDVIITDAHTNSLRAGSPTWTATPKGPNDPSPLTRPAQHAHRRQPGRRQHPPGQSLRPLDENLRQLADGMSVKLAPRQPRHHRGRNHRAGRPRPAPLPRTGRAPRPDGGRHPAGPGGNRRRPPGRNCARNRRRTPPSCRRWTTRATASRCAPAAATCARAPRASATT